MEAFEHFWRNYWFTLLPLAAMAIGPYAMWTEARRRKQILDLIKTYVDQGRDPPPELLAALGGASGRVNAAPWRRGQTLRPRRQVHLETAITFAAFSLGLLVFCFFAAFPAFFTHNSPHAAIVIRPVFATGATVFGVLAVGHFAMSWLEKPKGDD